MVNDKKKSDLEQTIAVLKLKLDQTTKENKKLKKQLETSRKGELWLDSIMTEATRIGSLTSIAFGYIEKGKYNKAKLIFDEIYGEEKGKKRFIEVRTSFRKKLFLPAEEIQEGAELINNWLTIRYENEKEAEIPFKVYSMIEEEKKKNPNLDLPNIPETIHFYDYAVMKEIRGPDLFEFYMELSKKPNTIAKEALIDAMIDIQLEYNAFIRTRDYGFDKGMLVFPDFEQKILEFYEKLKIKLTPEQKRKIGELTKPLNESARYPLRDGIPMNYRLLAKDAEYFLSDEFLYQENQVYTRIYSECKRMLNTDKRFFSYDHDDLMKMSFQSEDTIIGLGCYIPRLPFHKIKMHEENSVAKLSKYGEDIKHFWDSHGIKKWIKHNRWELVYVFNENYPDEKGICMQHHIEMAHAGLFYHIYKRYPSESEMQNMRPIAPEKTLNELVMHPHCRA